MVLVAVGVRAGGCSCHLAELASNCNCNYCLPPCVGVYYPGRSRRRASARSAQPSRRLETRSGPRPTSVSSVAVSRRRCRRCCCCRRLGGRGGREGRKGTTELRKRKSAWPISFLAHTNEFLRFPPPTLTSYMQAYP